MRIDIGWRDLIAAVWFCVKGGDRKRTVGQTELAWSVDDQSLITLSVRSGFDLILRALQLPEGSEIMMTAMTVPDMVRIVEEHGLVTVPVDIDLLGDVDVESLKAAVSEKTKMFVAAHLFGGQVNMEVVAQSLSDDVLIVEDCAQDFHTVGATGHHRSDFVLHSFGPIKTATALGGAVVRVAHSAQRSRMRKILRGDPVQSRLSFAKRIVKFSALKFLSGKRRSHTFCWCIQRLGYDVDSVLTSLGRGFAAENLLKQLRRQPCAPLLRQMRRRWRKHDRSRIAKRTHLGRRFDYLIGQTRSARHHYWVYPIRSIHRRQLCQELHQLGFDATSSSRLTVVEPVDGRSLPTKALRFWNEVVFLPWYPELSGSAVDTMAGIVRKYQIVGANEEASHHTLHDEGDVSSGAIKPPEISSC